MATTKTRADRLNDLVRRRAPKAAAFHDKHGRWPQRDPVEGEAARFEDPQTSVKKLSAVFGADPERKNRQKDSILRDAELADQFRRQAPYEIKTTNAGETKILLTTEDGDVIGGKGATMEDALAALEAKLS